MDVDFDRRAGVRGLGHYPLNSNRANQSSTVDCKIQISFLRLANSEVTHFANRTEARAQLWPLHLRGSSVARWSPANGTGAAQPRTGRFTTSASLSFSASATRERSRASRSCCRLTWSPIIAAPPSASSRQEGSGLALAVVP